MRLLSLFSGIGSFEKALKNIGMEVDLIGFSEIDKHAITSYCAIHGISESLNLGSITDIAINSLPKSIDMIVHGSPCQSVSKAGRNMGADKNSGTTSSLMWYTVEIVKHCKPKYVVWENVPNILSKKHKHNFNQYLEILSELGYKNSYKVLNAKDFGLPQNRERVFTVSILGNFEYEFPKGFELNKTVSDLLDEEVETKYYKNYNLEQNSIGQYLIKQATRKGFIELTSGVCDLSYPTSKTRRGRVQQNGEVCPTLTATKQSIIYIDQNGKQRELTSKEHFRLMGFDDADYDKATQKGVSNTQLSKQAGNSICVNVLSAIFKELLLQK